MYVRMYICVYLYIHQVHQPTKLKLFEVTFVCQYDICIGLHSFACHYTTQTNSWADCSEYVHEGATDIQLYLQLLPEVYFTWGNKFRASRKSDRQPQIYVTA